MQIKQNNIDTARIIIIALAIIFSVAITLFVLEKTGVTNVFSRDNTQKQEIEEEAINFNPPSEDEEQSGDKKKEDIVNNSSNSTAPNGDTQQDSSQLKAVKPVITSAGNYDSQIEVRSFIPGIYENTGICTVICNKIKI